MPQVKKWQNGAMALWWTAAAFDAASTEFRHFMKYQYICIFVVALDKYSRDQSLVNEARAS
jgi:hypothetical protein